MSKITLILILFSLIGYSTVVSQTISGTLSAHAGQEIRLEGFNGLQTYQIASVRISSDGRFSLSYAGEQPGMGLLIAGEGSSFVVVLSGEDIRIEGEALSNPESLEISNSEENTLFEQFAAEHIRREQTLSAWVYLNRIYQSDMLFSVQNEPKMAIAREIERIKAEDEAFLANLNLDSFIHYYLPLRKLVSSVPVVAQFRTEDIPETIYGFRTIDFTDPRLYRTGLLGDILESHIWLIENSGRSLDSVFVELNSSLDLLLENLSGKPERFNEISEYVFDVLEQRSLFTSSEHLALNLLTNYAALITNRLSNKLEKYRAMRIGNKAADVEFTEYTRKAEGVTATRLSEVEADYIFVIFAAQWCPFCREMMPELRSKYKGWREHGVEVVMINLDETPEAFHQFTQGLTFISTTDFRRWNSPMAQAYHLSSIPTYYLLNSDLEILLKPNSIRHMDAWVDWYLVQGNR